MGNHNMVRRDSLRDEDFQLYCKDNRLNITLLTHKHSRKEYMLRKLPIREHIESLQCTLNIKKGIRHPNVCPLIEYRFDVDIKSVHLLFEVPFRTIEEVRMETTCMNKSLAGTELLPIMYQMVQGLVCLRKLGFCHRAIKGSNFSMSIDGKVQIIDPLVKTLLDNFHRAKASPKSYPREIYLSSLEYDCLRNGQEPCGHQYSSDVFSLGMVILQLGLLRTIHDVYSLLEGVRTGVLTKYIHQFAGKYGNILGNLVGRLLQLDTKYRIQVAQLQAILKAMSENKSEVSNSTSSDFFPCQKGKGIIQRCSETDNVLANRNLLHEPTLVQGVPNSLWIPNSQRVPNSQCASRSPSCQKHRSPNRINKKLLIEQNIALSTTIKEKLECLLQASNHLNSYGQTSLRPQRPSYSRTNSFQANKHSSHQRRNTTQTGGSDLNHPFCPQNRETPHNKHLLESFQQVAINTSIVEDSPLKMEIKNTTAQGAFWEQAIYNQKPQNEATNRIPPKSNTCFSFTLHQSQILEESRLEYNLVPSSAQSNIGNLIVAKDIPEYSGNQFANLRAMASRNRVNRHQSGDVPAKTHRQTPTSQFHVSIAKQTTEGSQICATRFPNTVETKPKSSKRLSPTHTSFPSSFVSQQPDNTILDARKIKNYQGEVMRGLKHGTGRFTFDDGGAYEGQWTFNRMHGNGKLFYGSGQLAYDGQWFRDKMQGFGKLHNWHPIAQGVNYKNINLTSRYEQIKEGTFKNNMRHGNGTIYMTNGEYYQGEFSENTVHGEGVYVGQITVQGRWQNGQLRLIY